MENIPDISIITTIYNHANCLPKVFEVLMNQKGDFTREFIFVNDGSPDNSLEVIKKLAGDRSDILIINQKNQGTSSATNVGIIAAKGKFVKLVDGDDILVPDACEYLLNLANETNCKVIKGVHVDNPSSYNIKDEHYTIIENPIRRALKFLPMGGASSSLIDRELLLKVGGCDERVKIQDYSLGLRLAKENKFVLSNKLIAYDSRSQTIPRLSSSNLRVNYEAALARLYFLQDNPDINHNLLTYAMKCHCKKASSWARKTRQLSNYAKFSYYRMLAKLKYNLTRDRILNIIDDACRVYEYNK